jgi:hypothetical protein
VLPGLSVSSQHRLHRRRQLLPSRLEHVPVRVRGERDREVPQLFLDLPIRRLNEADPTPTCRSSIGRPARMWKGPTLLAGEASSRVSRSAYPASTGNAGNGTDTQSKAQCSEAGCPGTGCRSAPGGPRSRPCGTRPSAGRAATVLELGLERTIGHRSPRSSGRICLRGDPPPGRHGRRSRGSRPASAGCSPGRSRPPSWTLPPPRAWWPDTARGRPDGCPASPGT